MVKDSSPRLFLCPTCCSDPGTGGKGKKIARLTVDGISAGFNFESLRPLVSISEKCEAVQSTGKNGIRQKTAFFCNEAVSRIIVSAIKGKRNLVTERGRVSSLTALRFFVPDLIPGNRTPEPPPVFSMNNSSIEDSVYMDILGSMMKEYFSTEAIANRLAKMILSCLQKVIQKEKKKEGEKAASRAAKERERP